MKKKLMMVAVLLGALSLGACVDDNESASVTDIRSAKAEQLRAVAALYQAKADAETAAAQAEADLKAAQAEYERAKAAAEQANADLTQEQIRQLQEEFNYKIAALQAKWEAKVAYWNSLKAQYQGDIWDNEDQNVQDAYARYSRAMDNVYTLTQTKMEQQVNRSRLEANIANNEVVVANLIAQWNQDIVEAQANLEKLNAMKEAQPSKDEYKAMMDELEVQAYTIINNDAHEALATLQTTENTYEDALESFTDGGTALETAIETLNELAYTYGGRLFATSTYTNIAEDEVEAFVEKYYSWPTGTFGANVYAIVSTTVEAATLELNRSFTNALAAADQNIENATGEEWETDDDGNIIWEGIDGSVNSYQSAIAYYTQEIEDAEAEITRLQTVLAGEQAKGDAADPNLILQYQNQIQTQEDNIESFNQTIAQYRIDLQDAQAVLNDANEAKAEIEADQKEYTAALAALNNTENQTAYQAAFDALEAPAIAYIEAQDASQGYIQTLADMGFSSTLNSDGTPQPNGSGTYKELQDLYDGIKDVQGAIDECEEIIATVQGRIDLATSLGVAVSSYAQTPYQIYNPITGETETIYVYNYYVTSNGDGITAENALALVDAYIEQLDAEIAVQEALVEQYYERLNTLLNLAGGSEETPETPEEGGVAAA